MPAKNKDMKRIGKKIVNDYLQIFLLNTEKLSFISWLINWYKEKYDGIYFCVL